MIPPGGSRAAPWQGMDADELTHILICTLTPDFYCPPAACLVEEKLGVRGKFAQDINAACSGFVYGLETARAMAGASAYPRVIDFARFRAIADEVGAKLVVDMYPDFIIRMRHTDII